jgi:lysophospholipase L1-like esterase
MLSRRRFALAVILLLAALPASAAEPFALKEGDRVVFLGNTLIEQEQRYGYWEAALTSRCPGVTFRNLGWSGDTVWGEARASFGTQADGFKHLKEHVLSLKPTVLIIGYGGNESFAGAAGLPKFEKGLNDLLDALAPANARIVLLSPLKQEDLGRPLPDPAAHNKDVALYRDKIRHVAEKRKTWFVDLFDLPKQITTDGPLTEDGLHPTAYGYWRLTFALEQGSGLGSVLSAVDIDPANRRVTTVGSTAVWLQKDPLQFKISQDVLLTPFGKPENKAVNPDTNLFLVYHGLKDGKYKLSIEGKEVLTATAKELNEGVQVKRGPDHEQAEQLRQAIIEKNRLYFYRWRPQNETYLFGFRKKEQGQNAVEIPQFDPLVAELEAKIAKLRVPQKHTYELKPE